MPWENLLPQLAATPLVRRMAEAWFRSQARRRLAELDHESIRRSQARTLATLVHHARSTRFGIDHDFRRVRTAADYRRLVPVRTLAELGQEYWRASLSLDNTTWPRLPYAAPFPRGQGPLPWLPLSRELLAAHGSAALTTLGLISKARPRTPLFAGRILVLGKHTPLRTGARTTGSLEALAFAQLPWLFRPFVVGPLDESRLEEAEADRRIAGLLTAPLTCIAGSAKRVLRFAERVRALTGHSRLVDVWPGLVAVCYSRGYGPGNPPPLREVVGHSEVLLLEYCFRPEGAIAIEDPRAGRLRLFPDHGVYFEFIPVGELGRPNPVRHALAEVEPGVPYGLALTTAGVWACLVDVRVCFESREPPLLRLMELPAGSGQRSAVSRPQSADLGREREAINAGDLRALDLPPVNWITLGG